MLTRFLALTLAALPAALAAEACSCMAYGTVDEKIDSADTAFIGTAQETAPIVTGPNGETGSGQYVTLFEVSRAYKGAAGPQIYVVHRLDSAACGLHFEPGTPRLIFAHAPDNHSPTTGLCETTGTRDGKDVQAALEARFPEE